MSYASFASLKNPQNSGGGLPHSAPNPYQKFGDMARSQHQPQDRRVPPPQVGGSMGGGGAAAAYMPASSAPAPPTSAQAWLASSQPQGSGIYQGGFPKSAVGGYQPAPPLGPLSQNVWGNDESSGGSLYEITSKESRDAFIGGSEVAVIDVYKPGCPPCQMIEPKFAQLASTYSGSGVGFAKENVSYKLSPSIRGTPTFLFFKRGTYVPGSDVVGADINKVTERLQSLL